MSKREEIEPPLLRFVEDMRAKLLMPKNLAKPHWRYSDLIYLLDRLEEEVGELKSAINRDDARAEVRREAADVANFAMMIADWMDPAPPRMAGSTMPERGRDK